MKVTDFIKQMEDQQAQEELVDVTCQSLHPIEAKTPTTSMAYAILMLKNILKSSNLGILLITSP